MEQVENAKKNTIKDLGYKSTLEIIISNLFTVFNAVVLVITILVSTTLEFENLISLVIIFINTLKGIVQEIKARDSLKKLSLLNKTLYKVNRDDRIWSVDIEEIVEGEYVYLNIGDQVPCDGFLVEGTLEVDESILTGESKTIKKDSYDKLYGGSSITSGSGLYKVTKVGESNYINHLVNKVKKVKKYPSTLRSFMDNILKIVAISIIPIAMSLAYISYKRGDDYNDIILRTTSSVLGIIPTALVLIVSGTIAMATIKLTKKKVLIKEEYSVETLARVNIFCFDKTGTITTGEMEVIEIDRDVEKVLSNYLSCFDDENLTTKALKNYLYLKNDWKIRKKESFSSDKKYSYVQVEGMGTYFFGAYDFLNIKTDQDDKYKKITDIGYRIITLAKSDKYLDKPNNTELIGYVVLSEKLNKNTRKTFEYFENEDIEVKIVSGDDYRAVSSLASQAGLKNIKSIDMTNVKEKDLENVAKEYNVFGRVSPKQKEDIIGVLRANGNTVAMSGDGVNDVLALRKADISFAVNNATAAAKNIASILLLTEDFSIYNDILLEGRRVINNIRQVASLFLSKTFFNMLLVIICIIFTTHSPFVPIELTMILLSTVTIPAFLLCMQKNDDKVKNNCAQYQVLARM